MTTEPQISQESLLIKKWAERENYKLEDYVYQLAEIKKYYVKKYIRKIVFDYGLDNLPHDGLMACLNRYYQVQADIFIEKCLGISSRKSSEHLKLKRDIYNRSTKDLKLEKSVLIIPTSEETLKFYAEYNFRGLELINSYIRSFNLDIFLHPPPLIRPFDPDQW